MALVDVTMPKMGESITEGTVIAWHKKPGDAVELDETLLEIGTDKVDTEVPSPTAGRVAEILVEEGATVEVGTLIARVETDVNASVGGSASPASGDGAAVAPPATPSQPYEPAPALPLEPQPQSAGLVAAVAPEAPVSAPASSAPAAGGQRVDVVMPKMGESITEGTVIAWLKKPGDAVELDETLLEIGTDKVDTEVPSPAAGTLVEILVGEGETVEVGAKIAVLAVGAGAEAAASAAPAPSTSPELAAPPKTPPEAPEAASFQQSPPAPAAVPAPVATPATTAVADGPIGRTDAQGRFVSPLVRAIAEKEGLSLSELSSITGSGREGRVSKADVLRYVEQRAQRPAVRPQVPPATPMPGARPSAPSAPPMGTPSVVGGERVEII
ncbi:MAG TPA: biotin/lipoyl-containing protein, partial [Rhodothermales bacterium]|nr:biotin/lipoyl-containing protein [Rhodothermales bacterium]